MSNKKLFNNAKNWLYRKFDALERKNPYDTEEILLFHKGDYVILIRSSGQVRYYYKFANLLDKIFPLDRGDFELILINWIADNYKIKVTSIYPFT